MRGVRVPSGKAIGADPKYPKVIYADRDDINVWEEVVITKHEPWSDIRLVAANVQLCVNEQTHELESRPAGKIDGYGGQWAITDDGTIATCEHWILTIEPSLATPIFMPQVKGNDFYYGAHRISLIGMDGFLDYKIFTEQGPTGLDPFIVEMHAIHADLRRVFMQGNIGQNMVFSFQPSTSMIQATLRHYVEYMNKAGIIPLLTFCVDNQVVKADIPALWRASASACQGLAVLFSWGNELDKNGGHAADAFDPGFGIPWSRGSATQDQFWQPNGATATEFHPVRDLPRTKMDAVASPIYMRDHGCGMIWMDEPPPADLNSHPRDFWELGRLYGTLHALAVYHNRQGQRGQLMTGAILEGAHAFSEGML